MNIPDYNGIGIYAIVDENGKAYIGSSTCVKNRISQHSTALKTRTNCNDKLYLAAQQGREFHCEILEKIKDGCTLKYLYERECHYIRKHNTISNGYNMTSPRILSSGPNKLLYSVSKNKKRLKDIIPIVMPKGEKDKIKARADSLNMSLNAFITEAIEHSMNFYQEQEDKLPLGKKWCRTPEGKAAIAKLRKTEDTDK